MASTLSEDQSTFSQFRDLFVRPAFEFPRTIVGILFALFGLVIAQSIFILLVKGFVEALFVTPGDVLVLADVLPSQTLTWFPSLSQVSVSRESLALWVPIAVCVAAFGKAFAGWLYVLNQQALAIQVAGSMRRRIFRAITMMPWLRSNAVSPGAWMSRVMNDTMFLQQRFTDIIGSFVRGGILVLSCIAMMAVVHWPTAVVLSLLAPIVAKLMGRTGRRIARFSELFQRELAALSALVLDLRARFDFIRAQHAERLETERFVARNGEYFAVLKRSIFVRSVFAPALEFFGFAGFAFVVWLIGREMLGAGLKGDVLLQFFVALGLIVKPLREIGEQAARFHETRGVVREVAGFLKAQTEDNANRNSSNQLPSLPSSTTKFASLPVIHKIEVVLGGRSVLTAEDVSVAASRAVAVVGASGAGKSTFVKVLGGIISPQVWNCDWGLERFNSEVAMVSQRPFLFDDTLLANLLYGVSFAGEGDGSSTESFESKCWDVLRAVRMDEIVAGLPNGLRTRVESLTSRLSGGQVQRLVIARALLRGRRLLVLDEATSALDPVTERDILTSLLELVRKQHIGLLAVTHRMQWLDMFDEVWVMDAGRIRERGVASELRANSQVFARLDAESEPTETALR